MSTAVASYHLPALVKQYIDRTAKERNMPKGKFLAFLIEDYEQTKEENSELKAYFEMAQNKEFLQEQILEAEQDFLTESKYISDEE